MRLNTLLLADFIRFLVMGDIFNELVFCNNMIMFILKWVLLIFIEVTRFQNYFLPVASGPNEKSGGVVHKIHHGAKRKWPEYSSGTTESPAFHCHLMYTIPKCSLFVLI